MFQTDDSGSEEVTRYTDGQELNIADLPANLQQLCENKKVIQLDKVDDNEEEENRDESGRAQLQNAMNGPGKVYCWLLGLYLI